MKADGVADMSGLDVHVGKQGSQTEGVEELGEIPMGQTEQQSGHHNGHTVAVGRDAVDEHFPVQQLLHHRGCKHHHGDIEQHPGSCHHILRLNPIPSGGKHNVHKLAEQDTHKTDADADHQTGRKLHCAPRLAPRTPLLGDQAHEKGGHRKCHPVHGDGRDHNLYGLVVEIHVQTSHQAHQHRDHDQHQLGRKGHSHKSEQHQAQP